MASLIRVVLSILIFGYVDSGKCQSCGTYNPEIKKPIVVGDVVKDGQKYPWMVSLSNYEDAHFIYCTSALISESFILTAAHCLWNKKAKCWKKQTCGQEGYREPSEIFGHMWGTSITEPLETLKFVEVIPHPDYKHGSVDGIVQHDIGLLKLKNAITCKEFGSPICIPEEDLNKMENELQVAGWGRSSIEPKKEKEKRLREGVMKQVDIEICKGPIRDLSHKTTTPTTICTVTSTANQLTCKGDSGSSIFGNFDGAFYSIGVTSTSRKSVPGCPLNSTHTYTKTFAYLKWIKSHVKELPKPKKKE